MQPQIDINACTTPAVHHILEQVQLHFGVNWISRLDEFLAAVKTCSIRFYYYSEMQVNDKGQEYSCVLEAG